MPISSRLQEVMGQVKPSVALPIIVEVTNNPSDAAGSLQSVGFRLKYVSKVLPLVYGFANDSQIQSISSLPFVRTISYDEPTYAL